MTMDALPGRCPGCNGEGEVGAPCAEKACAMRGLHHVPSEHATWTPERPADTGVGRRIEKYLLVRVLGAGGFGTVYLALQLPIRMQVAVKLLHRIDDPDVLEAQIAKFEGEARALATLNHPNVVRLIEYGRTGDTPFLVMEFVEGARTLKHAMSGPLREGTPLPVAEARHLLRQICDGLEAAHARGLVHRDVKPDNLMLQTVAGNPNLVRILDFGLVKFAESGSSTSHAMGTPAYLAPEQLGKKHIGPWTDVYALGVIAFEMLVGRRPFPGETTQEMLGKKIDPGYDPVAEVAAGRVTSAISAFLAKALAREPSERLPTAAAFRDAFDAALAAPPISTAVTQALDDRSRAPGVSAPEIGVVTVPGGMPAPAPLEVASSVPAPAALSAPEPTPPPEPRVAVAAPPVATREPVVQQPAIGFPPKPPVEATEAMPEPGTVTGPPLDTTGFWSRLGAGKAKVAPAARKHGRRRAARVAAVAALILGVIGVVAAIYAIVHVPGARQAGEEMVTQVAGATGQAVDRLRHAVADEAGAVPEGWARVPAGVYPGSTEGSQLRLEAPFLLAAREVTQAEWRAVFGTAPAKHATCGDDCPVEGVTWFEALAYANALSSREARTPCYTLEGVRGTPGVDLRAEAAALVAGCNGYRLPTAVEWEVAARAGKGGSAWVSVADSAWFRANSGASPHPVATRTANAWGLYDMLGNVREWTWDASGKNGRLAAGGSFDDPQREVGVAERDREPATKRSETIGFRVARGL